MQCQTITSTILYNFLNKVLYFTNQLISPINPALIVFFYFFKLCRPSAWYGCLLSLLHLNHSSIEFKLIPLLTLMSCHRGQVREISLFRDKLFLISPHVIELALPSVFPRKQFRLEFNSYPLMSCRDHTYCLTWWVQSPTLQSYWALYYANEQTVAANLLLITSCFSARGNIFGIVCLSVCVCLFVLCRLNLWIWCHTVTRQCHAITSHHVTLCI